MHLPLPLAAHPAGSIHSAPAGAVKLEGGHHGLGAVWSAPILPVVRTLRRARWLGGYPKYHMTHMSGTGNGRVKVGAKTPFNVEKIVACHQSSLVVGQAGLW